LANANAPASSEAQAYKARSPVFAAVYHHSLLAGTHRHAIDGASVQVQDVLQTGGAVKRYEPHSPLADANGDVWYPDVNVVEQMADMMSASRDFETNVDVLNNVKSMQQSLLKLGEA
ncbi:flagellar basal body rod protein FlgC, partial [Escherichia coli]|nr:flagellar basal body rod protein FlgC [Escherichia coli]